MPQKNSDEFEQIGTKIDPARFCYTLTRLRMQREVLLDLLKEYRGRTIDNIIENINQRISYYESKSKQTKDN